MKGVTIEAMLIVNNFGNIYSDNELDNIMIDEDQKLNSQLDQQNLLQ